MTPKHKISDNLSCPKCKKPITNKSLKHWECEHCGTSFRIDFTKIKKGGVEVKEIIKRL